MTALLLALVIAVVLATVAVRLLTVEARRPGEPDDRLTRGYRTR